MVDDCDLSNSLRRSDRIKTIVTIKQHHKELEIAEKLKKFVVEPNSDLNESQKLVSLADTETLENGDLDHQEYKNDDDPFDSTRPARIKDRLDRLSGKENELKSASIISSSCQSSLADSVIDSPSMVDSSPVKTSRKYLNSNKPTTGENQASGITEQQPSEFEFPPDYQCIDKNIYVCKRYILKHQQQQQQRQKISERIKIVLTKKLKDNEKDGKKKFIYSFFLFLLFP